MMVYRKSPILENCHMSNFIFILSMLRSMIDCLTLFPVVRGKNCNTLPLINSKNLTTQIQNGRGVRKEYIWRTESF